MMTDTQSTSEARGGGGRSRSRGGFGKYLRARGRRGGGRPAEFRERLVLEDEELVEVDPDSEEAKLQQVKYSRRKLGTNADRYVEPEPELNSDGEVEPEPEVDLSSFLEKQRISSGPEYASMTAADEEDVDTSLAHITSRVTATSHNHKKGQVQQIAWDRELDEMNRDKAAAEAVWDLKNRFKAKADKMRSKPAIPGQGNIRERIQEKSYVEAPLLPTEAKEKDPKVEMQDFLDDLLN